MNVDEMFECLSYAAIAFQTEVTPETAAVYCDQLGGYEVPVIVQAVRRAVGRCERFPTVKNIRDEIREVIDKRSDSTVARNMAIARQVRLARESGKISSADDVDALVSDLESKLHVKRLG